MLSKGELDELKIKIEEGISEAILNIKEIEKMTQPVKPENSLGRISRMDAINNKSVMEAALHNKKAKLAKLKIALSKIDQPGFGICTRCKKVIQSARLMYMPESYYCINCASRF